MEVLTGVVALTAVIVLLVLVLMFCERKLVKKGKVKLLINDDPAKSPEVDVGIVTGGQIENGNVLAANLKWPNESDELSVQPLTYQIGLAAAGQATPIHPLLDFHVPIEAGQRLFTVAAGDAFPEGFEAPFRLLAVDTATSPWSAKLQGGQLDVWIPGVLWSRRSSGPVLPSTT